MGWLGYRMNLTFILHIIRLGEARNAYRILMEKSPFGKQGDDM
jgi:hypothetical protein